MVAAITVAILLGVLMTQVGYGITTMVFIGITIAAVAIHSPFWALVIGIAQWAFVPSQGEFLFIQETPNQLQFIGPLIVVAALLNALKERAHDRLTPRLTDFTIGGLGVWGLISIFLQGPRYYGYYKWYTNRMILPMSFYYAVRLVRLTRDRTRKLLAVGLGAIALQSILMIREGMAGSSFLYGYYPRSADGVKPARGPFIYHWNAGTFLAQWAAPMVYMIAHSRDKRGRMLWGLGLLLLLYANTQTLQRAGISASLITIMLCLLAPRLRRTSGGLLVVLAIGFIPWSIASAGDALLDRFSQTDQSRYAYRTLAINLLKSPRWKPVEGFGWMLANRHTEGMGTGEEVVAWGSRRAEIAHFEGSRLHNIWLQIPLELGIVGSLFTLAIILSAVTASLRILRRGRERPVDVGLLIALWGGLISVGAIGFYQHVWHMPASMSLMWLFYGIIVSKPHVFDIDPSEETS